MKIIEQLKNKIESLGGTLDDGDYTINLDAPSGYVWRANDCCAYPIHYANNYETWLSKAVKDALPDLKLGLVKCTDINEIEEHRWQLGEETWGASEGAPDKLEWPT